MARSEKNNEKIATLKPKDELNLLKIAKYGVGKQKENASKALVYYNQNLVKYIVKGYSFLEGQISSEELIAEGIIALGKAIDKFDIKSKNRFATYAGYWIKQFIQSFIHKDQLINQSIEQKKSLDNLSEKELEEENSKFVKERYNVLYYDREYQSGDKDNKSYSLSDILSENNDNIDNQINTSDVKIHVNEILSCLDSLEDLTTRLYFGISPINLKNIYNISNDEEKSEIKLLMNSKTFKKKNIEEIKLDQKEIKNNRIVKKYTKILGKIYKTKEISKIIGKAEGVIRKLKQKSLKKLEVFGKERKLDEIL